MSLSARRVRVDDLAGGPARFGLLLEDPERGRSILALGAVSEAELAEQLEACGGPAAYARRFGTEPLDPSGVTSGADGAPIWVEPLRETP